VFFLALFAFSAAFLLTNIIRHYALSHNVLDIPNQRSSHTTPTPRGGGLAIVLSFAIACAFLFVNSELKPAELAALSSCLLAALIGFIDDHQHVAAKWRIMVHFSAALSALYFAGGFSELLLPLPLDKLTGTHIADLSWAGFIPGTVLLVWCLNLFNFMDGSDGIAASEAIFVSAGLAGFLYVINDALFKPAICLAAACLGFLCWNWPKARIFMGDAGSGFLGLLLGLLIILAARQDTVLLYCGLILFGIFVADASYTLSVRFRTGQKWYEAHCSHAYQRAARRFGHLPVLIGCWLINLCWLLPIALLVFIYPDYALLGLIISYLPLLYLAFRFKAGRAALN